MSGMDYLKFILYTEWISWFIHFFIFLILSRWSGIKWVWAVILVFAIEVWETVDWSLLNPLAWWTRLDTIMDLIVGCLEVLVGERIKRIHV